MRLFRTKSRFTSAALPSFYFELEPYLLLKHVVKFLTSCDPSCRRSSFCWESLNSNYGYEDASTAISLSLSSSLSSELLLSFEFDELSSSPSYELFLVSLFLNSAVSLPFCASVFCISSSWSWFTLAAVLLLFPIIKARGGLNFASLTMGGYSTYTFE